MIVVSDNGPLGFLVQIGEEGLLQRLYGEVLVPPAVMEEFGRAGTPSAIRAWAQSPPEWLTLRSPAGGDSPPGPGSGERDAIRLAKERGALLLCDDRPARNLARREGLTVTGTLGVLQLAHARGWTDLEACLLLLAERTDFRFPPAAFLRAAVAQAHELAHPREAEARSGENEPDAER